MESPVSSQPPILDSNKKSLTSKMIYIILILLILITIIAIFSVDKIKNLSFQQINKTPAIVPAPTIEERFISIPSKNDNILNSPPGKFLPRIIYFYKNTMYGKGEIASYLKSKIVSIDKKQKSLSINAANGTDKILIITRDYTTIKSIRWNIASNSKPNVKDITFDDLEIGDNVSVSSLQFDNQSYIAGTIVKEE